jgi:carbon-monoxide dehydrogenase medium subunit
MKAPRIAYARPDTLDAALGLLAAHGSEARVLAGGQSLVPMLNLRMAAPRVLVDINRVAGLGGIALEGERVRIGALTRHAEIERSELVARHLPLLATAIREVAHPAIRSRGTFGGSCALADPAAELPACALALGATFVLRGASGERRVAAADFFRGLYETALRPGELLVAAEFPLARAGAASAFGEFSRRHGDYAIVGLAACAWRDGKDLREMRLAFFGVADRPRLAARAASALEGKPLDENLLSQAVAALEADFEPRGDLHASAATRRRLAGVLLRRVAKELLG